jgi:DNA polymerase
MNLQEVEKRAASCTLCDLHKGRINPVFAKGNEQADIMICGMVPAVEENEAGSPFVGRAGKCLDAIIEEVGLTKHDVYITNIVKCFLKPGIKLNEEWIDHCISYLIAQIYNVKPKVIITLGADATNGLLGFNMATKIGDTRGRIFNYTDRIKIIPTYHPSYVIRTGGVGKNAFYKVVDDFKVALSNVTVDH